MQSWTFLRQIHPGFALVRRDNATAVQKIVLADELQILTLLRDAPHVARLVDYCPCDVPPLVNIFVEYCDGQDLMHMLEDSPQLPMKVSQVIFLQLLKALRYCHTLKPVSIMHRDLKPSNILLRTNGRVKLNDFGCASMVSAKPSELPLGKISDYSSPELRRREYHDCSTDVWSLGCVLYEMLTESRFSTSHMDGKRTGNLSDDLQALLAVFGRIGDPLARMLDDPSRRQTASEILDLMHSRDSRTGVGNSLDIFYTVEEFQDSRTGPRHFAAVRNGFLHRVEKCPAKYEMLMTEEGQPLEQEKRKANSTGETRVESMCSPSPRKPTRVESMSSPSVKPRAASETKTPFTPHARERTPIGTRQSDSDMTPLSRINNFFPATPATLRSPEYELPRSDSDDSNLCYSSSDLMGPKDTTLCDPSANVSPSSCSSDKLLSWSLSPRTVKTLDASPRTVKTLDTSLRVEYGYLQGLKQCSDICATALGWSSQAVASERIQVSTDHSRAPDRTKEHISLTAALKKLERELASCSSESFSNTMSDMRDNLLHAADIFTDRCRAHRRSRHTDQAEGPLVLPRGLCGSDPDENASVTSEGYLLREANGLSSPRSSSDAENPLHASGLTRVKIEPVVLYGNEPRKSKRGKENGDAFYFKSPYGELLSARSRKSDVRPAGSRRAWNRSALPRSRDQMNRPSNVLSREMAGKPNRESQARKNPVVRLKAPGASARRSKATIAHGGVAWDVSPPKGRAR